MKTTCPFDLPASWRSVLADELEKPYLEDLARFIEAERRSNQPIYPPTELTFNALIQTPYEKVRVVIVGQDPYHGPGQAHGLCFSVPPEVKVRPSLRHIFKELESDLGIPKPNHGCLLSWAQQGVLMLNATLTVRDSQAKSHYGKGWELFTDAIITAVLAKQEPVVFLLWGNSAKEKVQKVEARTTHAQHLILTAAHPSPLSAYQGFFGCRHFSQTNAFLKIAGYPPINWCSSSR